MLRNTFILGLESNQIDREISGSIITYLEAYLWVSKDGRKYQNTDGSHN